MRYIVIPFLLFNIIINAQIKVLFDATKAETANNADWIIDADQFNLGYNPTAYIGGNEANAQQIPTPSQNDIISTTSQEYWKGALSAWAVDCVKQGYEVETLPYYADITYADASNNQDLSNYDIFIVCEPNILFTTLEKIALMNFVENGGGLFMISDHDNSDRNGDGYDSPDIWNDFVQNNSIVYNPFGIIFDYEYFTEATNNIPIATDDPLLHGSYGDVTSVEFYGGTTMSIDPTKNSSVTGVVYREGYTNSGNNGLFCAYATYGDGKVVALGDSSPADDGTGDTHDNLYDGWIEDANGNHERLIMNATIWLAESSSLQLPNSNNIREKIVLYFYKSDCYFNVNSDMQREYSIAIYDSFGSLVFIKKSLESNSMHRIPLLGLSGVFFYNVIADDRVVKRGKFLLIE